MAIEFEDYQKYDIKRVMAWTAPKEDGAPLLTMPNIPHPLHGMAPRTIFGPSTWSHMRKKCYYDAGYKCQACGKVLGRGECHAHEVYSINYPAGESKFVRTVCLCEKCHVRGIHSGRMLTLYKKGDPLMTKARLLDGVENLFKIIHDWNVAHPDEKPLRAYATFIDYTKWPTIATEMKELIKKYDMKFYIEDFESSAKWADWHLIIGSSSYKTKYIDKDDWAEQMKEKNQREESVRPEIRTDGIFGEIDEIIKFSKENRRRE